MEHVQCILCGSSASRPLFSKPSKKGELFTVNRCSSCGLEYLSPRPGRDEIGAYYNAEYFSRRTDRGYDDYLSREVRKEIERVFVMNLSDLGFYEFEENCSAQRRSLDIGCAAGYFVSYLQQRGWDARGIDISEHCVSAACDAGLNVDHGNYLEQSYDGRFDLITLWASIEHLHDPHLFVEKIARDLAPSGIVYISTCRTGGLNFMKLFGRKWRFYNFPEHLYFFSNKTMKALLHKYGFAVKRRVTYGSGIGSSGTIRKRVADAMAKKMYMGDMMLVSAEMRDKRR